MLQDCKTRIKILRFCFVIPYADIVCEIVYCSLKRMWIGLSNTNENNEYTWENGTKLIDTGYTSWRQGEIIPRFIIYKIKNVLKAYTKTLSLVKKFKKKMKFDQWRNFMFILVYEQ